jgi:hypothetical protein
MLPRPPRPPDWVMNGTLEPTTISASSLSVVRMFGVLRMLASELAARACMMAPKAGI